MQDETLDATSGVKANAKPGAYPYGDRANLFGMFLTQFFDRESSEAARARAYEGMLALTWPKARKNTGFMKKYEEAGRDGKVDYAEMHKLVIEMCVVLDELGTWDYPQDEESEWVVPNAANR